MLRRLAFFVGGVLFLLFLCNQLDFCDLLLKSGKPCSILIVMVVVFFLGCVCATEVFPGRTKE